jgi:hypothetical protein
MPRLECMWLLPCDGAKVNGKPPDPRMGKKAMNKFIAAAALAAAQWQPAHAQTILGSIPEEFRGGLVLAGEHQRRGDL